MLRPASSSASLARSAGSARSTGRTSTMTPYCSVIRSASVLSTSSRRAVMIRWCPRAASSMASASPMFCEAPVTTARASGLGAGTGMGRTISWATVMRNRGRLGNPHGGRRSLAWALWDCRRDGCERDRRDVRLLGLPDRARSATTCPAATTPRVGWAGRWRVAGLVVAVLAPRHRRLGRRAVAAAPRAGRADRAVVAAHRVDEPGPRRLPTTCGSAWCCWRHRRVQRPRRPCPTTRCCASSRRRRRPAGSPDSVPAWAISAVSCCC